MSSNSIQGGFIKLQRVLKEHWLWTSDEKFSKRDAFIDLIFRCNHRCSRILIGSKLVLVKRGQFISSNYKLAASWKWDEKTVRKYIKLLEDNDMVKVYSEKNYTLYEVTNYPVHQSIDMTEFNHRTVRTKSAQSPHRVRTKSAQSPPNKNVKNVKNEKNKVCIKNFGKRKVFTKSNTLNNLFEFFIHNGMEQQIIDEALARSKKKDNPESYAKGILINWKEAGIKTLTDLQKRENKKRKRSEKPQYSNFEQREYSEEYYEKFYENLKD